MAKFSGTPTRPQVRAPVTTTSVRTLTHEGGVGYERDAKSALFLLAVTNMVGEATFYEAASDRDRRFEELVRQVVAEDPDWLARFVPFLRDTMQMRSASVVLAGLYVAAGGPAGRRVVASACSRADEPAEMLAWWVQTQGRKLPAALKRGLADAVARLYDERAVLRYDGLGRAWRMGDVVELVHPTPRAPWQSALFRYLLDRRHHGDGNPGELLPNLAAAKVLEELDPDRRRSALRHPSTLTEAGFSWERLSGWLPGGMDAEAWEAVIPSMGYMALLRNLRNFDQAGVSSSVRSDVAARLSDPTQVATSRQFPIRFLSAWKAIADGPNVFGWGASLEQALDHSVANIPALPGRTLILVDLSGSMWWDALSKRSTLRRWEAAGVFGAALAKRNPTADLYAYSNDACAIRASGTVLMTLRTMEHCPVAQGGTNTEGALRQLYDGHDRIVLLTDEQAHDAGGAAVKAIPCPIYTFNLAGYAPAHLPSGSNNRYTFGGLTDAGFRAISLLESGRDESWPF